MKHSLIVAALLALGLVACGKKEDAAGASAASAVKASAPAASAATPVAASAATPVAASAAN